MPDSLQTTPSNVPRLRIPTRLTELLGIDLPIVCGPMFMVSDIALTVAAAEAGILGSFPALNFRAPGELRQAIRAVKERTDRPYAVNLITNPSNVLLGGQLDVCVDEQVPVYITSLGNPEVVIERAHAYGAKVLSDVTTLEYARKVIRAGSDAVTAVVSGAGGHVGHVSPVSLVPYLRQRVSAPILLAGGVADGRGLAAALALGADGVQMGTRFIASRECGVTDAYKQAVIKAGPDDIMLTSRISGQPASVIETPYTRRLGSRQSWWERLLTHNRFTKRAARTLLGLRSVLLFGTAAHRPTWRTVWSAGQSVGLVEDIRSVARIVDEIVAGYTEAVRALPQAERPAQVVLH